MHTTELNLDNVFLLNFFNRIQALNLSPSELKLREIINIDILDFDIDSPKYDKNEDPSLVSHSFGPLKKDWFLKNPINVMCIYKLVNISCPYFGIQDIVESTVIKSQKSMFLKTHRQLYCCIDEWINMDIKAVLYFILINLILGS